MRVHITIHTNTDERRARHQYYTFLGFAFACHSYNLRMLSVLYIQQTPEAKSVHLIKYMSRCLWSAVYTQYTRTLVCTMGYSTVNTPCTAHTISMHVRTVPDERQGDRTLPFIHLVGVCVCKCCCMCDAQRIESRLLNVSILMPPMSSSYIQQTNIKVTTWHIITRTQRNRCVRLCDWVRCVRASHMLTIWPTYTHTHTLYTAYALRSLILRTRTRP